jgi:hypothetical protein
MPDSAKKNENLALIVGLCAKFYFDRQKSAADNRAQCQILFWWVEKWSRERPSATNFTSIEWKVVPRIALCDIFCLDWLESGPETGSLRHILLRLNEKWFRERLSATNFAPIEWKVVSRPVLCDIFCFDWMKNGSETRSLRHILLQLNEKWFREPFSATNSASIEWKVVTRTALCDIFCFDGLENGSENGSLRQILLRLNEKWFRERLSATYFASIEWKIVPRLVLCDIFCFDWMKNGSENTSLRHILLRLNEKWFRDPFSATNSVSIEWKMVPRTTLCDIFFLDRLKSGSENNSLRQILTRLTKKWFRERFSATNFNSID